MIIKIRKTSHNFRGFGILEKGDWIDLAVCGGISHKVKDNIIKFKQGDRVFIDLGFSAELPEGFEAYILPRSSTFKKTGLILTNSKGIIDESYNGDGDVWKAMFYATKEGEIAIGQRLLQFRLQKKMEKPTFKYVSTLGNNDRGGYGSSGM